MGACSNSQRSGTSPGLENALDSYWCWCRLSPVEERVLVLHRGGLSVRWGSAGPGSGFRATVARAGTTFPIPTLTGNAADMEHTRKRRGRKMKVRGRRCLAPQHCGAAGLPGPQLLAGRALPQHPFRGRGNPAGCWAGLILGVAGHHGAAVVSHEVPGTIRPGAGVGPGFGAGVGVCCVGALRWSCSSIRPAPCPALPCWCAAR